MDTKKVKSGPINLFSKTIERLKLLIFEEELLLLSDISKLYFLFNEFKSLASNKSHRKSVLSFDQIFVFTFTI